MEEYKKSEIIEQSRHQFIYGYDGKSKTEFLKELEKDYPILANNNVPMAIYLDEFAFPKTDIKNDNLDASRISIISMEYLNFCIAHSILEKSKGVITKDEELTSKIQRLIKVLN